MKGLIDCNLVKSTKFKQYLVKVLFYLLLLSSTCSFGFPFKWISISQTSIIRYVGTDFLAQILRQIRTYFAESQLPPIFTVDILPIDSPINTCYAEIVHHILD